ARTNRLDESAEIGDERCSPECSEVAVAKGSGYRQSGTQTQSFLNPADLQTYSLAYSSLCIRNRKGRAFANSRARCMSRDENGNSLGVNLEMRRGGGDDLAVGIHRHFAPGLNVEFPAAGCANLLPRTVTA